MDAATGIALGTLITTAGGLVTLVITNQQQNRRAKAELLLAAQKVADVVKAETDKQSEKLNAIHELVNSNWTKLNKKLTSMGKLLSEANATIVELRKSKTK